MLDGGVSFNGKRYRSLSEVAGALLTTRAALLDVASHRDRRRPENIIEDVRKSLLGNA